MKTSDRDEECSEWEIQLRILRELKKLNQSVDSLLQPELVFIVKGQIIRSLLMKDTEQAVASLAEVDAKGFPVAVAPTFDAPPSWTVDDPTVVSLTPSADGTTCTVAGLKPGNFNLSVAASIAGKAFAGTLPSVVTAGDAAALSIVLGAPTPQ
jgi:hypothetical protein